MGIKFNTLAGALCLVCTVTSTLVVYNKMYHYRDMVAAYKTGCLISGKPYTEEKDANCTKEAVNYVELIGEIYDIR